MDKSPYGAAFLEKNGKHLLGKFLSKWFLRVESRL